MAGSTYDKRHYEDFTVGEVMEYGALEVTAEAIIAFAREYDPEPYHTDPEAARDTSFGTLVAAGYQTAAITFSLFAQTGALTEPRTARSSAITRSTTPLAGPGAETRTRCGSSSQLKRQLHWIGIDRSRWGSGPALNR